MQYILLNFAYGFGPFLRTAEVALKVLQRLEARTKKSYGVLAPLVYGEKQKSIMREEFGKVIEQDENKLLLDENLGKLVAKIFYGKLPYADSLKALLVSGPGLEEKIRAYLDAGIAAETFDGKKISLSRKDICLSLVRSPRMDFGINPAYNVSFALISDILQKAQATPGIKFDRGLLKRAQIRMRGLENRHRLNLISEPGTFDYSASPAAANIMPIPPTLTVPPAYDRDLEQGIYVTVTGIPGLARLFSQAKDLRLKIYTNQPESIPGSVKAMPEILSSPSVLMHFARSGWGSAWLSQFTGTPFIMPPYDPTDDPEIYFNNERLEQLSLGKIFSGQNLEELLSSAAAYSGAVEAVNGRLLTRFHSLNGVDYAAENIVKDYIR